MRKTLDVSDVAEILGISRAAAYTAIKRGEIASVRVGGRILVPCDAVDILLGKRTTASRPGDRSDDR